MMVSDNISGCANKEAVCLETRPYVFNSRFYYLKKKEHQHWLKHRKD